MLALTGLIGGSCHRTVRCGAQLLSPDSNFGPHGDGRGDFLHAGAAAQPPRRTLPMHCRAGIGTAPILPVAHRSHRAIAAVLSYAAWLGVASG
jgi:hypothetical protein